MDAYDELMTKTKEITLMGLISGVAHWDLETYMPPKGIMQRSEQLAVMGKHVHKMFTSPEVGKLLSESEKASSLNEVQKRNLFLVRTAYDEQTKVPGELVAKLAKQRALTTNIWKKAKAKQDWKMFEPDLQKLVDLSREKTEIIMKVKGTKTLYDTLLDHYERGMTASMVSKVFKELRNSLVPLTKKCAEASKDVDPSLLKKIIPVDAQRKIATDLAALIGYDTTSDEAGGRIDETEHPFTTGYYDDVRITVKYHEDDVNSMIFAILHEGGHALYEQNLNPDWKFQPVGNAASYGIHESMSRFVENMVGRSPEFLQFYLPRLNELTSGAFSGIPLDQFVKTTNLVSPSKIRIEADEVTYSLHIIIRFEIEQALFADKVTVSELPSLWNEKYEEYLGLEIQNDSEGVMQDTHWGSGFYGYFPSYALGNVYDGMWLEKLNKDMPDWLNHVSAGEITTITKWLAENIQHHASLYDPGDLAERVTGKKLTAKPFLEYVAQKYSNLFGF
jgi:carboxypeptidase Taq